MGAKFLRGVRMGLSLYHVKITLYHVKITERECVSTRFQRESQQNSRVRANLGRQTFSKVIVLVFINFFLTFDCTLLLGYKLLFVLFFFYCVKSM